MNESIVPDNNQILEVTKFYRFFKNNYLEDSKIFSLPPEGDPEFNIFYSDEVNSFLDCVRTNGFFRIFDADESWFEYINNLLFNSTIGFNPSVSDSVRILTTLILSEKSIRGIISKAIKKRLINKIIENLIIHLEETGFDFSRCTGSIITFANKEMEIFDVRWLTQNAKSKQSSCFTTEDDFDSYINLIPGDCPEGFTRYNSKLRYKIQFELHEGAIFISKNTEEKWNVYFKNHKLLFQRSATGKIIFICDVVESYGKMLIPFYDAESIHNRGNAYNTQIIDFLIKRILFNIDIPCPISYSIKYHSENIALFAFSEFGRHASFATYEYVY